MYLVSLYQLHSGLKYFEGLQQPTVVFYKNAVLKNLAEFTEKHLCWSLFLLTLQVFRSSGPQVY